MEYSVSIYKDKKDNILIIPQGFDVMGIRRDINMPLKLESPYSYEDLGGAVVEAFEIARNAVVQDAKSAEKVYDVATGVKSWLKFSGERKLVVGVFSLEKGYRFEGWERKFDGSYVPGVGDGRVLELGVDASRGEIGEGVGRCFLNEYV